MKIDNLSNNMNFKSGWRKQLTEIEKNTNPARIKEYFKRSPYTDWQDFSAASSLEFRNNKAYALACRMCAKIFIELRKKHDYRHYSSAQNLVFPHGIYVFNEKDLSESHKNLSGNFFTTNAPQNDILKNNQHFERQTIFLNNSLHSLEELNYIMNENRSKGLLSSSHFLHFFIHEWIHAIEGKLIYNLTNDLGNGNYDATRIFSLAQKADDKENEIVADILGEYAARRDDTTLQYAEIFAEAWTKFICNSLNEDCSGFKKDPIDELKKTPKEFKEILKKASTVLMRWRWSEKNQSKLVSWNNKEWNS